MSIARRAWFGFVVFVVATVALGPALGQGPPPARRHTVNQSPGAPVLIPATQLPDVASRVTFSVEGDRRVVRANGIPDHDTGPFPNRGNPNSIRQQPYMFDMPAAPKLTGRSTRLGMHDFGIAIDGVPFDPGAAEWYEGVRGGRWQYEPLSGAINLGLDSNYAHVQPSGAYHYHGLPTLLLDKLDLKRSAHSPLIGWAADGFPIYALYGLRNPRDPGLGIKTLRSSYRLKEGRRPSGAGNPGGVYDGTFTADYAFVPGSGDLDECNGRVTVTPEFPQGTYAYFLTRSWPVVPRCYKGTPSRSFTEQRARMRPPPRLHPKDKHPPRRRIILDPPLRPPPRLRPERPPRRSIDDPAPWTPFPQF